MFFKRHRREGGITLGKLVCGFSRHRLLSKLLHLTVPCLLVCPSKTSWHYLQNDCAADPLTAAASRPTMRPFLSSLSFRCFSFHPHSFIHSFTSLSVAAGTLCNPLLLDVQCYFVLQWERASVIDFGTFFIAWKRKIWQMEKQEVGPYFLFWECVLFLFRL